MKLDPYAELFLRYNYAETKDLCKHLLTVITTVLVVSLTFSDKVVGFATAPRLARRLLVSAWCAMLLAIIAAGIGLMYNALAGGQAVYGGRFAVTAQTAYKWVLASGGCFLTGLGAMIATAVVSLRPATPAGARESVPAPDAVPAAPVDSRPAA